MLLLYITVNQKILFGFDSLASNLLLWCPSKIISGGLGLLCQATTGFCASCVQDLIPNDV